MMIIKEKWILVRFGNKTQINTLSIETSSFNLISKVSTIIFVVNDYTKSDIPVQSNHNISCKMVNWVIKIPYEKDYLYK